MALEPIQPQPLTPHYKHSPPIWPKIFLAFRMPWDGFCMGEHGITWQLHYLAVRGPPARGQLRILAAQGVGGVPSPQVPVAHHKT